MTKKYWFTSLSRLRAPGEQSYFYPHLLCPWPSTGPWDSHLTRAQTMPSGNSVHWRRETQPNGNRVWMSNSADKVHTIHNLKVYILSHLKKNQHKQKNLTVQVWDKQGISGHRELSWGYTGMCLPPNSWQCLCASSLSITLHITYPFVHLVIV